MRLVSLGFRCNNACVFCAQGKLREQDTAGERDVELAIRSVEPGEVVAFVGGEPTLHERLPDWMRAAHLRGARRVLVQTNGRRLAYRSYTRELALASDRLALDVALHGSSEAMHDYHTQVPGSFVQTVRGLRNARDEGLATAITTVVTRSSFRHLVDVVRLAQAVGVDAVHLDLAERVGSAARDAARVVPSAELASQHIARAAAEARRLGLGVLVLDEASSADVRDRFAGIGEVEQVHDLPARRVGLPVVSPKEVAR